MVGELVTGSVSERLGCRRGGNEMEHDETLGAGQVVVCRSVGGDHRSESSCRRVGDRYEVVPT